MLAGRRVLAVLGAIVGVVVLTGVVTWASLSYFDYQKSQPARQLVDTYFGGYRSANLEQVKSTLGEDMAESLPGSQTAFATSLKQSTIGQIKSWTITKIDRNDYIGQSLVDVQVVAGKQTFNLQMDMFTFTRGLKIRSVVDVDAKKAAEQGAGNAGALGGGHTGLGAGSDGAGSGM
jgi:hypothetical protein